MATERTNDIRASRRKPLRYPVWMDTGEAGSLTECILSDVSEGGAKLKLSNSMSVPPKFSLRLTGDGSQLDCVISSGKTGATSGSSL